MTETTVYDNLDEANARVDILERRLKRITAERNRARADFAKLSAAAQPFANQTLRSMRKMLDEMSPDLLFQFSRVLGNSIKGDSNHVAMAQLVVLSEAMANAIDGKRRGEDSAVDLDLCADRLLRKLDQIYGDK